MESFDLLTPRQAHAARVLVGLSQIELAQRARISQKAISSFETGAKEARSTTKRALVAALEEAGAVLLKQQGVALRAA